MVVCFVFNSLSSSSSFSLDLWLNWLSLFLMQWFLLGKVYFVLLFLYIRPLFDWKKWLFFLLLIVDVEFDSAFVLFLLLSLLILGKPSKPLISLVELLLNSLELFLRNRLSSFDNNHLLCIKVRWVFSYLFFSVGEPFIQILILQIYNIVDLGILFLYDLLFIIEVLSKLFHILFHLLHDLHLHFNFHISFFFFELTIFISTSLLLQIYLMILPNLSFGLFGQLFHLQILKLHWIMHLSYRISNILDILILLFL